MEVLDGTSEGGDLCGGAVGVRYFLSGVAEEWWSDFVGVTVKSGKEDLKLGAAGACRAAFRGCDVLGQGIRCKD